MWVYMIRHGESETNVSQTRTGWMDVSLTEKGREQAEIAGRYLRQIRFDRIITSDLSRAQQTAQIALPGCSYTTSPLLREINVGDLVRIRKADCPGIFGPEYEEHTRHNNFRIYHGEDWSDMMARVDTFRRSVEGETGTIGVFAHAGTLRAMMDLTFGMPVLPDTIQVSNCCISLFHFNGKNWYLAGWDIGRLPEN